jgi:Mn-dependent DtxR family transcriptional regulator
VTANRPEPTSLLGSSSVQDYLEQIYNLIRSKGYARVVDIAAKLGVAQPSVTNMIQRLDAEGLVIYERYRGVALTEKGLEIGSGIARRHELLTRLLSGFGLEPETVYRDVEGLEHHLSEPTLRVIALLVEELEENPRLRAKLRRQLTAAPD